PSDETKTLLKYPPDAGQSKSLSFNPSSIKSKISTYISSILVSMKGRTFEITLFFIAFILSFLAILKTAFYEQILYLACALVLQSLIVVVFLVSLETTIFSKQNLP
ncbi:MAG: hypothetical protein ACK4NF_05970, partial [Planctomycetota bacterium]